MEQQIGSFEEADKYLAKNRITSFEDADKLFASQTEAKLPPGPDQASRNMADAGELTTPKTLSRKYVAPFVQPVLTGVGGGLGAAAGSPLGPVGMLGGGFSGGMLGNVTAQYLQNQAPGYFGESGSDPNSSVDQLTHAAKESAYQESGGMAIGAGINAARNVPELIRAGKPLLSRTKAIAQAAQDLNPSESTEDLIKTAQQSAQAVNKKNEYNYNMAAGKFDATAIKAPSNYYREVEPKPVEKNSPEYKSWAKGYEPGTNQGPPEPTYEKIQSPIPITKSQVIGKEVQTQVEGMLTGSKITDRPLQSILDTLKPIMEEGEATDAMGTSHGVPVTEFQKIDALNESLKDVLTRHPDTVNADIVDPESQVIPSLTKFQTALQEDIDRGVSAWGPKAYAQYAAKKDAFTIKSNAANPSLAQKLLIDGIEPETTYESVAAHALKDQGTAEQFIRSTNDRPTLAKLAQRQVYDKSVDPNTGIFDPGKALAELNSNPIYNTAIPSQALSNTKEWYKALSSNQDSILGRASKRMGIGFYSGGGLTFAIGHLLPHGFGGYATAAVAIGGGIKLSGAMINKLMLNPTTARALIQMARTPIGSPMIKTLSRVIFSGLKGENNLQVIDDTGNTFDAQINNQGNLVVH